MRDVPQQEGALNRLLLRDRLPAIAALGGVTAVSWTYLLLLAQRMDTVADGLVMTFVPWSATDILLMCVMWWLMMAGMMMPGAAPMILVFDRINKGKRQRRQPFVATAVFAAGYLVAWGAFSVFATAAQWALESAALMVPMMQLTSPVIGGAILLAAGLYQFTPLKRACLTHCRSPFAFVMNHWRDGTSGALRMGAEHGAYCLGCCWVLMALLFVGGVMDLLWVAAIAVSVLAEKLFPAGEWIARIGGVSMATAGLYLMVFT